VVLVIYKDRFLKFFKQYYIMVVTTPIQEQQNEIKIARGIEESNAASKYHEGTFCDPVGGVIVGYVYPPGSKFRYVISSICKDTEMYLGRIPKEYIPILIKRGENISENDVYLWKVERGSLDFILLERIGRNKYISRPHIGMHPNVYSNGKVTLVVRSIKGFTQVNGIYRIEDLGGLLRGNIESLGAAPYDILASYPIVRGGPVTTISEGQAVVLRLAADKKLPYQNQMNVLVALVSPEELKTKVFGTNLYDNGTRVFL